MPAPIPLEYGATYHIYNRGNNRENLFRVPENYRYFLQLYAQHLYAIVVTFAYCLLPNHFHFLVRIKDETELAHLPNLKRPSQYFSNLFNAYTRAFNRRHGRTGALFTRPFSRILVDSDRYFHNLVVYIHRNPQRHGLVTDFREWPYSSYHTILTDKPTRVQRTAVLDWFGNAADYAAAHTTAPDEQQIDHLLGEDWE